MKTMCYTNSQFLVETEWLAEHLQDPDLCILDCTVVVHRGPEDIAHIQSGYEAWKQRHIPGSGFADLVEDLSCRNTPLEFMIPPAEQFAEAMSRYGVGPGAQVILYDTTNNNWAARVWWMLRYFGFDDVALLNGGWNKWTREKRPVSTDPPHDRPAQFIPRPRSALIADKNEVLCAIGHATTRLIDALPQDQHHGTGDIHYGQPGHIPSSINVPFGTTVDAQSQCYLPSKALHGLFGAASDTDARVITYCGWGIAASGDAFVLTLLGYNNVAVYDGSMSEWTADPTLPVEIG